MRALALVVVLASLSVAAAPPCLTVDQAQARIDQTQDGNPSDLKAKLRRGGHSYSEVSFVGACVEPGVVHVDGRNGLWINRADTPGVTWDLNGSTYIIFTGPNGHIVARGSTLRVEVMSEGSLTVTNSLLYAGKINGPNVSVDTVTGFLRNSDVGILEVVNSPGFQLGPGLTYTGS